MPPLPTFDARARHYRFSWRNPHRSGYIAGATDISRSMIWLVLSVIAFCQWGDVDRQQLGLQLIFPIIALLIGIGFVFAVKHESPCGILAYVVLKGITIGLCILIIFISVA